MARTFFSVWFLGNPQKLLTTNQFLVSTIFFTFMNISFFSLCFDLFSIIAKSQSNQELCSLCCSSPFLVLVCTYYGSLHCFSTYFRKLKEIGVLRPIFSHVISCDYGLRQLFATESPLKMMKNAFYFTLIALFALKIFKSLS